MGDDDRSEQHDDPVEVALAPEAGPAARWRPSRALVAGLAVLAVVLVAGGWALAGRDGGDGGVAGTGSGAEPGAEPGLWGHRWSLQDVRGPKAPELPAGERRRPVLDTTVEGKISFTGCNGGFGTGRLEGATLVVGELGSTDMACVDDAGTRLMAFDSWMAGLLASSPTVAISGSTLTISSAVGSATFEDLGGPVISTTVPGDPGGSVGSGPDRPDRSDPDPDPGSVDTTPAGAAGGSGGDRGGSSPGSPGASGALGQDWQVTSASVDGVGRAVLDDRDGNPLVLDLTEDGRIGFNGCNGGGAEAHLEGARLVVGGVMSTKRACTGPDGAALAAQDGWLAAFLESGPELSVERGTLTLVAGTTTVVAERVG